MSDEHKRDKVIEQVEQWISYYEEDAQHVEALAELHLKEKDFISAAVAKGRGLPLELIIYRLKQIVSMLKE